MSRRHSPRVTDTRPETYCGACTAPTANGYQLCGRCADTMTADLVEWADWLAEALADTITGVRGMRYSSSGGSSGSDSHDVRVNYAAAGLERNVSQLFGFAAMALSIELPGRLPGNADTLAAHADQLARRDGVADFADRLRNYTIRARNMVDTRPARIYLGRCDCGLMLYGHEGDVTARCDCGRIVDQAARRLELLDALDNRTLTAADAARLIAGGDPQDRERLRKRINQWNRRGLLIACHDDTGDTFRLGDIRQRLGS